jgi:hypothetical protein
MTFLSETPMKNRNILMTICLMLYFLMLPLGALSLGSFGSLLKYVAILPLTIYILQYRRIVFSKILIFQYLLTLVYGISMLFTIDAKSSLESIETNILFLILLIAVGCVYFSVSEIKQVRKALVWSSRITCILLLFYGTVNENRLFLSGRITEDPNYLNGYFIFGLINAVQIFLSGTKKREHVFSMIEMALFLYTSFLTGSRGGLIALLAAAAVIVFSDVPGNSIQRRKQFIALILLIIFIILMVFRFIPGELISRYYWRNIIASRGTHRLDYWKNAIDIFSESTIFRKFFGYGTGSIREIYGIYGFKKVVTHNVFIQQLLEGGMISIILYTLLIYFCLNKAFYKKDWFILSCLTGFVVLSLSTSITAFKPYWNAMIFSNLVCCNRNYSKSSLTDTCITKNTHFRNHKRVINDAERIR